MIYFDTSISWIGSNTRQTAIEMSSWRHNIKTKNQEEVPFGDIDVFSFAFSLVCRDKDMMGGKIWHLNGLIIAYNDVEKCVILSYGFISCAFVSYVFYVSVLMPLYFMMPNGLYCPMPYIFMSYAFCLVLMCLSYNNALCLIYFQTGQISLQKEKTDNNHPTQSPRTMAEWKNRQNHPIQALWLNSTEHRELPKFKYNGQTRENRGLPKSSIMTTIREKRIAQFKF